MSQINYEKFNRPPIREAIFIFNFSKVIPLDKIKNLTKSGFLKSKYPISQVSIQNNVRIDTKTDSASTSLQKLQDGLIFRSSEKNPEWVLQIKKTNFSLHKVGNYTSWENLTDELKILSGVLNEVLGNDLQIKTVSVRYINHIPILKTQNLEDWFQLIPRRVEGVPTTSNKFFLQVAVEQQDLSGIIIESVLEINSILNFVIDLRVTKPLKDVNIEFENIEVSLNEIREFKNQLFFSIITDKVKPQFK